MDEIMHHLPFSHFSAIISHPFVIVLAPHPQRLMIHRYTPYDVRSVTCACCGCLGAEDCEADCEAGDQAGEEGGPCWRPPDCPRTCRLVGRRAFSLYTLPFLLTFTTLDCMDYEWFNEKGAEWV